MSITDIPPLKVILLIEDMDADAHLTKAAFREGRLLVDLHRAIDGRDGLDFLYRKGEWTHAPRPDLILLDLNMPRMDGREFLAEVKKDKTLSSIPIVVLTTSEVERDIMVSYQNGASGYIVKPVDMLQFIDAIRGLGDYWLTLVRLPPQDG